MPCRDEAPAGSAEDDLFDWDPKEKQSSEPDHATGSKGKVEKKKKAPTSLAAKKGGKKAAFKEPEGASDTQLSSCRRVAVRGIWQTWTCIWDADDAGAFDEGHAQAAPNLENAPSDGVAEPLLLLAPTDDGELVLAYPCTLQYWSMSLLCASDIHIFDLCSAFL